MADSVEANLLLDAEGSSALPVVARPAGPSRRCLVLSAVSALMATAGLVALALTGQRHQAEVELVPEVGLWQAVGGGLSRFRVAAPSPFPGLQYRKSMNLKDRTARQVRNGAIVRGIVEGGGKWLRLEGGLFLPITVGVTPVMQTTFSEGKSMHTHKKASGMHTHKQASGPRKGSFLVIGDWGWDKQHHGNVYSNKCQKEIAKAMADKFDELGDVKFIINVGDSFYPTGVKNKSDPQWGTKWRNMYDRKLRSVPWYSVYGNHDYRGDPCACSVTNEGCAQVNSNESDLDYFYMPAPNWYRRHPELDLEVVAMDLNQYVGAFTSQIGKPKKTTAPVDCWFTNCLETCAKLFDDRAQEAFRMFYSRMKLSTARNMVVFSHYPTDYFAGPEPKFIEALSDNSKHHVEYFGGHRHDVDRTSTASTHPNSNWLVGGGGGWGCDGQKQGFVVGEIDYESRLNTHAVLVDPKKCCPGH